MIEAEAAGEQTASSDAFELYTELAGRIKRPMKLFINWPVVAVETWRVAIIVLVIGGVADPVEAPELGAIPRRQT